MDFRSPHVMTLYKKGKIWYHKKVSEELTLTNSLCEFLVVRHLVVALVIKKADKMLRTVVHLAAAGLIFCEEILVLWKRNRLLH